MAELRDRQIVYRGTRLHNLCLDAAMRGKFTNPLISSSVDKHGYCLARITYKKEGGELAQVNCAGDWKQVKEQLSRIV